MGVDAYGARSEAPMIVVRMRTTLPTRVAMTFAFGAHTGADAGTVASGVAA